MVLAVEHADGTAATVELAGKQGARFYKGWLSEEERLAQTRCAPFSQCTARSVALQSGTQSCCCAIYLYLPFSVKKGSQSNDTKHAITWPVQLCACAWANPVLLTPVLPLAASV